MFDTASNRSDGRRPAHGDMSSLSARSRTAINYTRTSGLRRTSRKGLSDLVYLAFWKNLVFSLGHETSNGRGGPNAMALRIAKKIPHENLGKRENDKRKVAVRAEGPAELCAELEMPRTSCGMAVAHSEESIDREIMATMV
ncbi:hypothetical protein CC1G_15219 [Coprinopsis cinerea okayama7|uniref:Uncharacterized protein n=1 Tax=Coprinopsis cinerea (strain Okayama-7 / 130 / ATCC MYA-4618 / FGSC 9003) TaxID=240176 RepID=D6RPR5_COPC7|nr:hypothetical protein CC1G_15219 [Coprinopsis cinerea okayama7\|eukprot:XP_002910584.1 hypothetical protein CC1G_15219 [Coprinopsis cinerea okayama7\